MSSGDERNSVEASGGEDGVALQSIEHPKGRGRVPRGISAKAIESVEIEMPPTEEITLPDGSKAIIFRIGDTPEGLRPAMDRALMESMRQTRGTIGIAAGRPKFNKKVYQRELMRKRRAAKDAAQ